MQPPENFDPHRHTGLIFLVGFMGCGKTTIGRKLAAKSKCPFIDLDHVLEEQQGMAIADFFSEYGEEKFRVLESRVLKETVYPERAIISTGGGLPCFFDNMEWMSAHGKTVYIKLSAKTLADRLEHGKEERPLLRHKHGDELIAFIEEKLHERENFYNKASIIADGLSLAADRLEMLLDY